MREDNKNEEKKENPYEYKSDMQMVMIGLSVLIIEMDYEGLDDPTVKVLTGLAYELSARGRSVKKASKFWPDKELRAFPLGKTRSRNHLNGFGGDK